VLGCISGSYIPVGARKVKNYSRQRPDSTAALFIFLAYRYMDRQI